jgi:ribonuclease/clavin/mitogillin
LGQGTSVFEDLGSYLRSLQKCWKILDAASPNEERLLYPAHGPTIDAGKRALRDYLSHRLEREHQILELLSTPSEDSNPATPTMPQEKVQHAAGWTIKSIVSKLYSNYPEHLYPAAARGIFLHLQKLASPDEEAIERGIVGRENEGRRVECFGAEGAKEGKGLAPPMPKGDSEWIHLMSLQWRLLDQPEEKMTGSGNGGTPIESKGSL